MEEQFGLRLRYVGGDADNNLLEAYDGSASIAGFAQSLQIATNAYLNHDVTNRSTALKNAKFFIKPSRPGSFITDLIVEVQAKPKGVTLNATTFYDFIKFSFSRAVGKANIEPETPYVNKLKDKDEPFFDDLAEAMEGSLQRAHKAIEGKTVTTVTLERPRGELVEFDAETCLWVGTRDVADDITELTGNVTRYNSVSGNGRVYVEELKKIVPFRPGEGFLSARRGLFSWSLHGNTVDTDRQLSLSAHKVESASGIVKRLLLTDCSRIVT